MRSFRIFLFLAALLPMLALFGQSQKTNAVSAKTNAVPVRAASAKSSDEGNANQHRLRPGDVLEVVVLGEEDLDEKTRPVGGDGSISLKLLGKVQVEGLTAEEAAKKIRELYMADYLVNPIVTVTVVEFAKFRFTIDGHVRTPGIYPYNAAEKINIVQAIAKAGGLTRIGDADKVTVTRVIKGKEQVLKVNTKPNPKDPNSRIFEIKPDDLINVGESRF